MEATQGKMDKSCVINHNGSSDINFELILNHFQKKLQLYLQQSPYFRSMFSGSWKESTMEKIDIHIIDPNIDLNALHIALGSLYQDEITVEPADVIPILAAASLFQVFSNIQYIMS